MGCYGRTIKLDGTRKAVTTDRLASAPFTSLPAGLEDVLRLTPQLPGKSSAAQVHRATVRDEASGVERQVAVKVQHRGLRETATGDIDIVLSGIFPSMPLWWIADEIAPNLPIELDF
ncbi:hypothetical protein T484DRAFT_1768879, partial [Baffinella frigidus]